MTCTPNNVNTNYSTPESGHQHNAIFANCMKGRNFRCQIVGAIEWQNQNWE